MEKIIIYTDGASRGNPGPAAIGAVICDSKGNIVKRYSKSIGRATNNEAEYQAVIFTLKKIRALYGKEKIKKLSVLIKSDSQLLVSQMMGKYKIKEENIQKLFIQAWNLRIDFKNIDFVSIPREENSRADNLANQALDDNPKPLL
jgi:ribonuclease HI